MSVQVHIHKNGHEIVLHLKGRPRITVHDGEFDPAAHPRGGNPENRGQFSRGAGSGMKVRPEGLGSGRQSLASLSPAELSRAMAGSQSSAANLPQFRTRREAITRLNELTIGHRSALRVLRDRGFQTEARSIHYMRAEELARAVAHLKEGGIVQPPAPRPAAPRRETAAERRAREYEVRRERRRREDERRQQEEQEAAARAREARKVETSSLVRPPEGMKLAERADYVAKEAFKNREEPTNQDFSRYAEHNTASLRSLFRNYIKAKPAAFVALMTKGLDTRRVRLSADGGRLSLESQIGGGWGGRISRSLNFTDKSVYHSYFQLPSDSRGANVAKEVLAHQIATYKQLGMKTVSLSANIDVGGYAWAKYGFKPSQSSWNSLRRELGHKLRTRAMDAQPDVKRRVEAVLNSSDPKAIWLLSDMPDQIEGQSVGKYMLLNSHWSASLSLDDRSAMARFNAYIK